MRVSIRPDSLTRASQGLYFDLGLRRQANGDEYLAKLHYLPNGKANLAFSRVRGGVETFLGSEQLVPAKVATGRWLYVEAQVTGTSPVHLSARAWLAGSALPGWQLTRADGADVRLTSPGSLALVTYLSRTAASSASIAFRQLNAWDMSRRPIKPSPSGSSTSTPSVPATTSSATVSTSSAPASTSSTVPPSASATLASSSASPQPSSSAAPPPAQTPASGSAPIGSTAYAPPENAVYVSPDGNDSANGTAAAPLATLGQAIRNAPTGTTIVLRAGTYHESVTVPATKSLTIQSYPDEAVWLDGSTDVRGWTPRGNTWVHAGWTAQFDSTPSYTTVVPTGSGWSFVDPAHPMAAHPDQVWVDGSPLSQVGAADQVGPGSFYVDYTSDELVVGSDPTGHDIRASDLSIALTSYGPDTVVRGLGFRRYATSIGQIGTVRLEGARDRLENVISTQNATTGVTADVSDVTVRNVTLTDNGMLGMHANYADGLTISHVLSSGNNTEHFNSAPVSGGIKVSRTRGVTVRDSDISDNLGYGLWLDESCYDMTVVNNTIANNTAHGLSLEISAKGIVAGNVITRSGADGLKINNTSDLKVWANTLTGNAREMEIVEDARRGANLSDAGHDPRQAQPDPTEPWIIENIQVADQYIGVPAGGNYSIYCRDYSGEYSAQSLNILVDGNHLIRPDSGAEFVWQITSSSIAVYNSVTSFTAATGQGQHNTEQSATALVQLDPSQGLPLPDDVAAAMGQPAGTRLMGAP